MDGFVTLLLFAGFFLLMMRYGCGAHMMHGHGGHQGHGGHDDMGGPDAKDPVCGMDVAPGRGYAEVYEGRQYRFCSRKCLDAFDAEPQHYASAGLSLSAPSSRSASWR